jgi:hypothetical protein
MNATIIKHACDFLPDPSQDVLKDHYKIGTVGSIAGIEDPELGRFLYAYKDLQFGWNFARTMAANALPMPPVFQERDEWVWRAYLYALDKKKFRDPVIREALTFTGHNMQKERAVLHALLINPKATIEDVALRLNRDKDVISAYECLFFNVHDRRDDHLYISSIVYPQGRLVEMYEHYIRNESLEMILLRAGYNHGPEDVLYFAGFPSDLLMQHIGNDVPARLEAMIMANGYLLAKNGWLNQGAGAAGMSNARLLMSAAKQGGQTETQSPFNNDGGRILMAELQRVKQLQQVRNLQTYYATTS